MAMDVVPSMAFVGVRERVVNEVVIYFSRLEFGNRVLSFRFIFG